MRRSVLTLLLLLPPSLALAASMFGKCSDHERERYLESVKQAVYANWDVPYDDESIECTVLLKQNWRGEVLHVGIAKCGDDPRVHKSVVDAGYSASPLPSPENKACRDRNIILQLEARALQVKETPESVDPE